MTATPGTASETLYCELCGRKTPARCCRALCVPCILDAERHLGTCPQVQRCEVCQERKVGLERCGCCGRVLCEVCHPAELGGRTVAPASLVGRALARGAAETLGVVGLFLGVGLTVGWCLS